jgi:prolyl 3-hydroxylase /prolyl 3,4-dihydroxylase
MFIFLPKLENLQPIEVCKSIQPKFNSLLFFEVSDRSFHQVAEVLSKSKTRYSINGWFHGEINHRPEPFIELIPEPSDYIDIEVSYLKRNSYYFFS